MYAFIFRATRSHKNLKKTQHHIFICLSYKPYYNSIALSNRRHYNLNRKLSWYICISRKLKIKVFKIGNERWAQNIEWRSQDRTRSAMHKHYMIQKGAFRYIRIEKVDVLWYSYSYWHNFFQPRCQIEFPKWYWWYRWQTKVHLPLNNLWGWRKSKAKTFWI